MTLFVLLLAGLWALVALAVLTLVWAEGARRASRRESFHDDEREA